MMRHNRFGHIAAVLILAGGGVFSFGLPANADRVTSGLVALYTLEEGSGTTVHDVSGVAPPLEIYNNTPTATTWITGGVRVNTTTVFASVGAGTKIINACMSTNQITVEAWVIPANITQGGPARILTLSLDGSYRNFTLGQSQDTLVWRLRTSTSTLNGSPYLYSTSNALSVDLHHVAATFDNAGQLDIYVDGISNTHMSKTGDLSTWDSSYQFALANELSWDDRSWLGDIYLAAVYNRALSASEIMQNFLAGADPPTPTVTVTDTHTPTATATPTRTVTPTRTSSPTPTASATPPGTFTATPTATVTLTPVPSATFTQPPTLTHSPTASISPTSTISPSTTATPTPTLFVSATPSSTSQALVSSEKDVIAFPQPATGDTLYFHYLLPSAGTSIIDIFNVAGEKVKTIRQEHAQAGLGRSLWSLRNAAPGVYIYQLRLELANGEIRSFPSKKAVIVKLHK
ncbi:MAG: LamG-like jellyroll fold domain-containing protein [candidate division FCPU426 bacterium]